jgi:hypothetical protein
MHRGEAVSRGLANCAKQLGEGAGSAVQDVLDPSCKSAFRWLTIVGATQLGCGGDSDFET